MADSGGAARPERDPVTGVATTGHEWDGIKELNNPLPKWWLYVFYACILFSLVWYILFPSWPTLNGYFGGIIGSNQRVDVEERIAKARAAQSTWRDRIATTEPADIMKDPELLSFALAGGEIVFKDNCAPCHGLGGAGQLQYPTLADDSWIWGGTLDDIAYTIRHGIRNNDDPDARYNMMPAYGADELLDREQIAQTVEYVMALGGKEHDAEAAEAGAQIFAENCAACHGDDGTGLPELGGPNLTDAIWLYGEGREAITAQINRPQHGIMPAWQTRLDEDSIKMVTVYVHSLGGGR